MMNEEEQWSLELKIIAYRQRVEAQNILDKKAQDNLSVIRQEKSQIFREIKENVYNNITLSLPYTIPLTFINIFLMKSILIAPITLVLGACVINKLPFIKTKEKQ